MNKTLKTLVIILNIIAFIVGIIWWIKTKDLEPVIVILTQLSAIIILAAENQFSKIITKRVENNSKVDVDVLSGDQVITKDIKSSDVKIKVGERAK